MERGAKSRQTISASQLVDYGRDVESHWRESLCKAGTREVPSAVYMYGKGNLGSTEVGQELSVGDDGQRHGTALYR